MSDDGEHQGGPRLGREGRGRAAAKAERLAAALRENLRRRKAQARGRADGEDGTGGDGGCAPPGQEETP